MWGQQVPPNRWYVLKKLHVFTYQEAISLILLGVSKLVQKFLALYGSRKLFAYSRARPLLITILSQIIPVHTFPHIYNSF
jgi:hypothetical protein